MQSIQTIHAKAAPPIAADTRTAAIGTVAGLLAGPLRGAAPHKTSPARSPATVPIAAVGSPAVSSLRTAQPVTGWVIWSVGLIRTAPKAREGWPARCGASTGATRIGAGSARSWDARRHPTGLPAAWRSS
jgi:hypothetical protein